MNKHERQHSTKEEMKDYNCEKCEGCENCCNCKYRKCNKLCPVSFGLALGLTKGLFVLAIGLGATFYDWGHPIVQFLQSVYKGYAPSVAGSLYGSLYALISGFVFGFILVCIYDFILCCCKKAQCRSNECKWDKKQHHKKHH